MRIFVTGASGYIGGRLVRALAGDPAVSVTAAGRSAGYDLGGVHYLAVDWSDPSLAAACSEQDVVIHLAAMNEAECERDPEGALRCNGLNTANLLRAAQSSGVRRFIYVSTSKVFGNNPSGYIDERTLPRPMSHYAITHHVAEDYVLAARSLGRVEGIVLRLSNSFGTPATENAATWALIVNDLCRQAALSGGVELKSSGLAWRNFVGMGSVVAALRHVAAMPEERIGNGLFHLGGPRSMPMLQMAELVAARAEALFGGKVNVTHAAPGATEKHVPLDWRIRKLAATGWDPIAGFTEEIDAVLHHCKEVLFVRA